MPRACPVEVHAHSYTSTEKSCLDATGKPVASGALGFLFCCSGDREDSTGPARGIWALGFLFCCSGDREVPRDKPVASASLWTFAQQIAQCYSHRRSQPLNV